jgi:neutral ceramidase
MTELLFILNRQTGHWNRVRDDSDWELIFNWKKRSEILGTSEVEIVWETEGWTEAGQYRFKYYGDSKAVGGTITAFEGVSGQFVLT